MRSRMIATSLVGLALVLAGCGGDDDEETTTSASKQATTPVAAVTKADYIAQADAICKAESDAGEAATNAAVEALGTASPTDEQLATIASDVVLPGLEKQLTALKALPNPEEGAEDVDAIYADLESAIGSAKEDPSILTAGEGSENPFAGANEKAKAFGMQECGKE